MATKAEIKYYAKTNNVSMAEAKQHFIDLAKATAIHVLPLDDNSVYKGKTIYQYMTANNIKNAVISGIVFDLYTSKQVAMTVIVSNNIDEETARDIGYETWKFNGQQFPGAERVAIWLPLNDILEQTFSGTGPLTMGNETGYSGNFLSRVVDMIGIKDVYKKLLADAYKNNKEFATSLDNIDPKYGRLMTA